MFHLHYCHVFFTRGVTPMDFAEHLRKSDVTENSKVYYGRFLRNVFMKGIVILVKVDEMCSMPPFIGREMKMELDDQSFCWSLPLNAHTFTKPLLY